MLRRTPARQVAVATHLAQPRFDLQHRRGQPPMLLLHDSPAVDFVATAIYQGIEVLEVVGQLLRKPRVRIQPFKTVTPF